MLPNELLKYREHKHLFYNNFLRVLFRDPQGPNKVASYFEEFLKGKFLHQLREKHLGKQLIFLVP